MEIASMPDVRMNRGKMILTTVTMHVSQLMSEMSVAKHVLPSVRYSFSIK